jgi:hypothetical protein
MGQKLTVEVKDVSDSMRYGANTVLIENEETRNGGERKTDVAFVTSFLCTPGATTMDIWMVLIR